MIQKIRQFVLVGLAGIMLAVPSALTPVLSGVASANLKTDVCEGSTAASQTGSDCAASGDAAGGIKNLAKTVTRWFSLIVGAISIIMIIYGGFRYITSGGDSGRVGSAKNTLIYAIVGLIIVALAQLIVNVVITQSTDAGSNF